MTIQNHIFFHYEWSILVLLIANIVTPEISMLTFFCFVYATIRYQKTGPQIRLNKTLPWVSINCFALRILYQLSATTQMPRLTGQLQRVTKTNVTHQPAVLLHRTDILQKHGYGELHHWILMAGQFFLQWMAKEAANP